MRIEAFEAERPRLVALAYRMLGDVSAAEDVVQEAWLRALDTPKPESPRAFLSRVVVRLCIDEQRAPHRSRVDYEGPWLPEPIATQPPQEHGIALAEDLSYACFRLSESLSPLERAAFVLSEVAECSFAEIGEELGRSESAVRQLAHRARTHLESGQARHPANANEATELAASFVSLVASGDVSGLARLFAPSAVMRTDHGGKATSNLRDILGAAGVAKAVLAIGKRGLEAGGSAVFAWLNGQPAIVGFEHGVVTSAVLLELARDESGALRIARLDIMRNPDKLARLQSLDG